MPRLGWFLGNAHPFQMQVLLTFWVRGICLRLH